MSKRSAKLLLVVLIAAWVGVLLTAGDSPAQLYRYNDKNGNVVLTDNPPPGVAAEAVEKDKALSAPPSETAVPKERQPQAIRPAPPSRGVDKTKEEAEKAVRDGAEKATKEEADRVAKEEADRETNRLMAEEEARKQAERQRRLEEADRLEREAKKPIQPTQENIDRQMKLMQEAQRLREMQ
jgi:colicin import membrane protein